MEGKEIIEEQVERSAKELSIKIERYIRLHIRPKPKYLPRFIWEALLQRMLVLEQFDKTV